MVKLTQSLAQFLFQFYPSEAPLVMFGHTELLTKEIWDEYTEWCLTEEGAQYLKGGKYYKEEDNG